MTNVAQDLAEQLAKAEVKLGKAEEQIAELEHEAAKNLRKDALVAVRKEERRRLTRKAWHPTFAEAMERPASRRRAIDRLPSAVGP